MTPAATRDLGLIRAELARLARYDDESIVHDRWVRQRYDRGFASYVPARKAAVVAAWHEAGHAAAALAVGARFSSASILYGRDSGGRVNGIRGRGDRAFVVDAAGQIAERLREWTMLESDDELRAWLAAWKNDGGDARHFRAAIRARFGADEFGAWRYSEEVLTPLRLRIRHLARALLVHPRHLPYEVAAALAADVRVGHLVPGPAAVSRDVGQDGPMLDHISIQCADPGASAAFYDAVLAPLGGRRVMDFGEVIGYGLPDRPEFWIGGWATGEGFRESHIAFTAPDRASVRAFFAAATSRGATVLHEPRVWPEYHPNYYGAFVRDPDGNNVEAVCHRPE